MIFRIFAARIRKFMPMVMLGDQRMRVLSARLAM